MSVSAWGIDHEEIAKAFTGRVVSGTARLRKPPTAPMGPQPFGLRPLRGVKFNTMQRKLTDVAKAARPNYPPAVKLVYSNYTKADFAGRVAAGNTGRVLARDPRTWKRVGRDAQREDAYGHAFLRTIG